MTITRDLCLLHRWHRSISVISRASRLSPLIYPTKGERMMVVIVVFSHGGSVGRRLSGGVSVT